MDKTNEFLRLLDEAEPPVRLREVDLLHAACIPTSRGREVLEGLLKRDESVQVSEVGLIRRMKELSTTSIPLLLTRDGGLGTTPAILKAIDHPRTMKIFLKHRPTCDITEDILEVAASRSGNGDCLLKLLLEHDPSAQVSYKCVLPLMYQGPSDYDDAPDLDFIMQLMDRMPEQEVTDEMIGRVKDLELLDMLLERRGREHPINAQTLESIAAVNSLANEKLVARILQYDPSVKITGRVLHHAFIHANIELVRKLLELDPELTVCNEDIDYLETEKEVGRSGDEYLSPHWFLKEGKDGRAQKLKDRAQWWGL